MDFGERVCSYKKYRRADNRLVDKIEELLHLKVDSVIVDIGAGTGNYSQALIEKGYKVISVEPEEKMRKNGVSNEINWVDSFVEKIELPNDIATEVMIVNAIHHFSNVEEGIKEVYRIMKKGGELLIFTFDPIVAKQLWLFDYWPRLKKYEDENYDNIEQLKCLIRGIFGEKVEEHIFEIPYDFEDVFSAATWRRPYILLEKEAREAMSLFNYFNSDYIEEGITRLKDDLISGKWEQKYHNLIERTVMDVGCRILCVKKNKEL